MNEKANDESEQSGTKAWLKLGEEVRIILTGDEFFPKNSATEAFLNENQSTKSSA